jgi:hypothetical protein
MQDNEPLMHALSNLIVVNSPDLVLFVGEALVGNDAVDQLTKFNQRLADLAQDAASAHTIDGILLTKFDTIDDKARNLLGWCCCTCPRMHAWQAMSSSLLPLAMCISFLVEQRVIVMHQ